MNREDAVKFTIGRKRLDDYIALMKRKGEDFKANFAFGMTEPHEKFCYAANPWCIGAGETLFIVDISGSEVSVEKMLIDRVAVRANEAGVDEPVVVDTDGRDHTWSSLGLVPDFETGEWSGCVPLPDIYEVLAEAIRWLAHTYGQDAEQAIAAVSDHLRDEYGVIVVVREFQAAPVADTFHC